MLRRLAGFALPLFFAPLAFAAAAASPVPDGWFAWPTVEPAAGSALDVSALNAVPAGAAGRIAVRDGSFVTPDGKRVRFWGCNVSGGDAFVSGAAADALARHLARGGVNIARLHHLDNPWGVASRESIWSKDRADRTRVDLAQLDKLHRMIAALRDQGIYTNLNLKVSKFLGPADGFAATVTQFPDFQKRVDLFSRRMIELQKDYARQMLTTKNPYTGLAPADDPAVAVVELNNENSLLGYFTRDLGRGLENYPEPFRGELRALWNEWLARRYADDAALAAAWRAAAGAEPPPVLAPAAKWWLKAQPGATARFSAGPDSGDFAVEVLSTSGIDWHVQVTTLGLRVEEGAVYTIEFEAQADTPRAIAVGVANDSTARPGEDWRSFGLLQPVEIGPEWTPVRFVFPAHSVAGSPASLSLNVGARTGAVRVRHLRFLAGAAGGGLAAGASPRAGTVDLPSALTTGQWRDWIRFLADTERAFAEEMRAFLKNELKVRAPIVCSQIDFGGITAVHREQSMDFADAHGYWQHPDFPHGEGWNPERWTVRNSPQIAAHGPRGFGQLGANALTRIAGKPFSVSEYDHPAPSDYACEMYAEFAAIACRQDWDALYPFALAAHGVHNPTGRLTGFFDQIYHPAKWAFAPFATTVFRREWIAPATASAVLHPGTPVWSEAPHADVLWNKLSAGGPIDFFDTRLAVSDRPDASASGAHVVHEGQLTRGPVAVVAAPQGKTLVVRAERAAAAVGFLGGAKIDAGALTVECPRFGRDFAAVTAVALDGRELAASHRVLVTLAARAGNRDMKWNESRTSVGANWGEGPTIAERVPATITLAGAGPRTVYALQPDGTRGAKIPAQAKDGALVFTVRTEDATMHYEVVAP